MADGRYTRIKSKFWTDEKVRAWDDTTKFLALYILTSPHNNILGCYVLPKLYICADLGWDMERLDKVFTNLFHDTFIKYDDNNNLLFIVNYLKHNPIENGNQAKGAQKKLTELPKSPLLQDLEQSLKQLNKPFLEPLLKLISKPVTVTETVTETVNNICATQSHDSEENTPAENPVSKKTGGAQSKKAGKGVEFSQDFEDLWKEYPRKKEKQAAYKCYLTRKKEGHLPRDMLEAARRYQAECNKNGTNEKYIKLAKTFLGPSKPFEEYIIPDTTCSGKVVEFNEFKPYTGEGGEFIPYRG